MQKFKKVAAVLLALLMALAITAGCKSKPQAEDTTEIVVGIAQDIDDSLDPHKMSGAGSREVAFNIFEGLVKPETDGTLKPAVASDFTISETGDTFTFTLRQDVSFHNGQKVTAEDVVYSISRCAGLDGAEPLISVFSAVESVTAPDDKTVVVKLRETNIEFLANLTAAIIPKDYDKQETAPVGTGPYKFISRAPQESIILESFDGYWGGEANIKRVTFKIIDNTETLMMSLRSGAIDFCAHLTASQMNELDDGSFNFEIGTMNIVQAVYLNNAVAPFDNADVRRALAHAVNREEIMEILSGGLGVPVGSSMYPGFTKYFVPELAEFYDYNPEKSKQMLAEAGYADGFDLEIVVPSNYQPHIDTATVIAEQLRAVGVRATIKLVEWGTWYSDVYSGRDYAATVIGVDASAMTARAMLERFVGDNGRNFINFKSDEYDEVFAAAAAQTDDTEQTALYKRLQAILAEQAANLYIQDLCDVVAIDKSIGGFEFYPLYILDLYKLHIVQ